MGVIMKKYIGYFLAGTAIYFGFAGLGYAETTVSAEVQYIFNTLLFLMSGFWSCGWPQVSQC